MSSLPTSAQGSPDTTFEDRVAEALFSRTDRLEDVKKRQLRHWLLALFGLLLLLSIFSSGFFLFAVLVIGGIWLVSTLWASFSLEALKIERELARQECEIGEVVDGSVVLTNGKSWPAWWLFWREQADEGVDLEGTDRILQTLAPQSIERLDFRIHTTRRGLFRIGPAVMEATGPFGLVKRYAVDRQARFLTVFPRTLAIGQGWPLGHRPVHEVPRRHSLFEDPSRFLGIRPFRRGDGLRRIHWRATARSQDFQVKIFEPAVLEGMLLAVEMSADAYPRAAARADGSEPRLELAISVAASLLEFVLAGNQRVGLLSNGADAAERFPEEWSGHRYSRLEDAVSETVHQKALGGFRSVAVPAGKGGWQRDHLRNALARLMLAPGPSLAELLMVELPRLPRSLVLAIITPRVDEALASAIEALRRSGIDCAVVGVGRGEFTGGTLPGSVPVYAVRTEDDLARLGSARL